MKQVFRCEYCDEMGTAERIKEHEADCIHNYDKRSCLTCRFAARDFSKYTCPKRELPEGKYYEFCADYEWDEKDYTSRNPVNGSTIFGAFGSFFG